MSNRIERLTSEIQHMERRIKTVAMSKPDHDKACSYLAELHAQRWQEITEAKLRNGRAA